MSFEDFTKGGNDRIGYRLVGNDSMGREVDGNHVNTRLGDGGSADLVEADLELLLVDGNTEVAVVGIVVLFEDEALGGNDLLIIQVADVSAVVRLLRKLAVPCSKLRERARASR